MCVCEFYVCECMYELMGVYVQVHVFYILIACCMFTNNLIENLLLCCITAWTFVGLV